MRFEDLDVWKRSARLSVEVYRHFKESRDFGFKDQITRSSLSISSNIAEGYERRSNKELINFLSYAKGSCGELRSQTYIGIEIGYINRELGNAWIQEAEEISRMLASLMAARSSF
ncbi:four helix bundle protein [Vibrio breoganii]|uniref:four helix bundle protein n=1 Tax=Vibrio breoganii TaxID=553239 RepID=UPI000C842055|nr:four helix bundle protein [Vibrio breoganii]PMK74227.1 four helix bundle protein [Vibrio breoganii]PMO62214.1 four helix bundle protein [Vibrio breoganii]PMO90152.1 four helix bundle protein [Vibrio breoganii]